jgi:hypothetical protein
LPARAASPHGGDDRELRALAAALALERLTQLIERVSAVPGAPPNVPEASSSWRVGGRAAKWNGLVNAT